MSKTAIEQMSDATIGLIRELEDYPGWKVWQRRKIGYVLAADNRHDLPNDEIPKEFRFSDDIEKRHSIISLFLHLNSSLLALKDVEYYFRRYPFRNLPVSHHSHVTYICEMYFSRFYEFRERLKKYLNALNDLLRDPKLDVGKFIKLFDSEFAQELKARHAIHHHQAFDEIEISHVFLAGVLPKEKGWGRKQTDVYRLVTKQWVERVRRRSTRLEEFLEAVAHASIENCEFLASLSSEKVRGDTSDKAKGM